MTYSKKLAPEATLALVHTWHTMRQAVHPLDWAKAHPPKPETAKPDASTEAGQPTVVITPPVEEPPDDPARFNTPES